MKNNPALTKLIGLLYVAALFLLGVSPPRIAPIDTPKPAAHVEQASVTEVGTESEETPMPVETGKPLWEALQETDVTLSAGVFSSGSTDLTLVLQPGETALLDQFNKLQSLDASGSTNYEELRDWGLQHPEVALLYTLPLPTGQVLASTAREVDLTGIQSEQVAETAGMLVYAPELKTVELGTPDDGTLVTGEDLELLRQMLPQAEIRYTVTLLGKELDPNTESLDLSELKSEDVPGAVAALSGLGALKDLILPGGEEGLSLEEALSIAEAVPGALVHYPVSLYGKSFDLADEGLDLNHIQIPDQGETVRLLLPCMHACTWLDMDSCGVDNEIWTAAAWITRTWP